MIPPRPFWVLSSILLTFFSAGCSSDQADRPHRPGKAAPPLAGQEMFFDGRITAEITVGHGIGLNRKPSGDGEEPGPERRHHGGGGGFHMGGGRRHQEGEGPDKGDMSAQVDRQRATSMRHAANTNPPVMIHLRFTNNGSSQAELLITDFLSPLGNFVVEPDKLSLAPGQSLEVEPMTSRIVGEISGATVSLALRLDGRGEKKNVVLTLVAETPPAASTVGN